jgi:hypothetical protein
MHSAEAFAMDGRDGARKNGSRVHISAAKWGLQKSGPAKIGT